MAEDKASELETADSFRRSEEAFKNAAVQHKKDAAFAAVAAREQRVKTLSKYELGAAEWEALIGAARTAARNGAKEFLLLRFPSGLCSDDSRAINNPPNDAWPDTLRGEAAEIYQRWHETLKPHGFELYARVLDFPDGRPGDVGLFLRWGEDMAPAE